MLRFEYMINSPVFVSCKIPEFFEMSPFSEAEKHPYFQVTRCLRNVSTEDINFTYIESEIMPIFSENISIFQKFFTSTGLNTRLNKMNQSYHYFEDTLPSESPVQILLKTCSKLKKDNNIKVVI